MRKAQFQSHFFATTCRTMRHFANRVLLLTCLLLVLPASSKADVFAKLNRGKMSAISESILSLRDQWQEVPRAGPFREFRANLHVHSHLSHDSRGTIDEILVAAKAAGTSVLMFTEHPAEHYDFFEQGHRGLREGVLLIPGAETQGFLAFPTLSLAGLATSGPQEFSDFVRGRGGLTFVSHLEERMDWNIRGVTGQEIYNTHADAKDETKFLAMLRNPLWLLQSAQLLRDYPQETFSALQDYPADYLRRWDELCLEAPHTGVAANDAHQNIGLLVRWVAGDRARVEDALGQQLLEVPLADFPRGDQLRQGKQAGDVLVRLILDEYEYSLRHVGTHLLMTELNEQQVREALEAGRAFVAFDWLADATGFDFAAMTGQQRYEMGSQLALAANLTLVGHAPLPAHWRLLRSGQVVQESDGPSFSYSVAQPGNYRAELWLEIAGERMLWVLSNPLYIGDPQ